MFPFHLSLHQGDNYLDHNPAWADQNLQRWRNRLTRYYPNSESEIESLQWFIGGKRHPVHKLLLSRDREGAAFEYLVRWGEIGPQKRLDMYQGVFNGFSRFPVILIPLSHHSYHSDIIAKGIDLRNLANRVTIHLTRSSSVADHFRFFTFLQCTGVLIMSTKNGIMWHR